MFINRYNKKFNIKYYIQLICIHTMDPEWKHAYSCLKARKFYPITYKIDHTKTKSQMRSSVAEIVESEK